jgi:sugar lactone lactonase YvrE
MNALTSKPSLLPLLMLAGGLVAAGCDDSTDGTGGASSSTSSASTTTASSTTSSASSTTGSTSASSGTGGAPAMPTFVAHLDPMKGELAEGLFVKGQTAYVGLAGLGKVVKVALPGGAVTDFGNIPPPPMNGGFLLGIVVDAADNVYVGFGGGPGMQVQNGIYKIPAAGGATNLPFAVNAEMNFPNGLYLDASTDIYVADSGGAIFKVSSLGLVTKWKADPLLVGTDLSCMFAAKFPIGANGITRIGDAFYVANTNLGSIVKIPINADGTAGAASVFAGPSCDKLGGIDGIDVAPDGKSILAVINSRNEIVSVDETGKVTALFTGAPLDNPASLDVSGTDAFITNSAFFDMAAPAPGLLVYPLD